MTKYHKDEIIRGHVTGIEKYGIFVTLDEYYSGLIHISEISDGYVKDINNIANIGDTIRVRVVDVDDDAFHVKLSIKNLNYHISRQSDAKIKETENGFDTLESELGNWISKRKNEKK